MGYMFEVGFLGTRAPFFMDFVTLIVGLLPLLVGIAVGFARKRRYATHRLLQILIFWVSVLVVGYFEYGVRLIGGYERLSEGSGVSLLYIQGVLLLHILIAVVTLGIWSYTLLHARADYRRGTLPGLYSQLHKRAGRRTFMGIVLTSLSGIGVYLFLFVL